MKLLSVSALMTVLAGSAAAHSWLECVDTVVKNKKYSKDHPSATVDQTCKGFPRNKFCNGDWISESSRYSYNFNTEYACRDNQRTPGQTAPGAPMATASPGDTLLMRYWGNGHTRWDIGSPNHRDPGLVRIYWAGKPETEIVYAKDLTEKYWIPGAQANFSADTVTELTNGGKNMREKANYFSFTLPEKIQNGRHMMVWSWAWKEALVDGKKHGDPYTYDAGWDNAWGTCFDIVVKGSHFTGEVNTDILCNKPGYDDAASSKKAAASICGGTCLRGGMATQPCSGDSCPPCWYKNAGQTNCYAYGTDGKCPWTGAFDCKKGALASRDLAAEHGAKHRRHSKKH